jgi:hypothetical protein
MFRNDVVGQKFRGEWQNESAQAIDRHEQEAEEEKRFSGLEKLPDFRQGLPGFGGGFFWLGW